MQTQNIHISTPLPGPTLKFGLPTYKLKFHFILVCTFQLARLTMTPRAVLLRKGKRNLKYKCCIIYKLGYIAKEFLYLRENLYIV